MANKLKYQMVDPFLLESTYAVPERLLTKIKSH